VAKKFIAAFALALIALFAVPTAANAAGYVPQSSITVTDSTPAPGVPTTISFAAGAFLGSENVVFTLTGENAVGATLASFKAVVNTKSITKVAAASGSTSLVVTLPLNAVGTYTVTATGATSGNVATAALTVTPAVGSSSALPHTGSDVSGLLFWAAGGILLLVAGLVVVLTVVRRQRAIA
jgi:LPXTG-motif cell wall-anchored protein